MRINVRQRQWAVVLEGKNGKREIDLHSEYYGTCLAFGGVEKNGGGAAFLFHFDSFVSVKALDDLVAYLNDNGKSLSNFELQTVAGICPGLWILSFVFAAIALSIFFPVWSCNNYTVPLAFFVGLVLEALYSPTRLLLCFKLWKFNGVTKPKHLGYFKCSKRYKMTVNATAGECIALPYESNKQSKADFEYVSPHPCWKVWLWYSPATMVITPDQIKIDDQVSESPMGEGFVTGITEEGLPTAPNNMDKA